MDGRQTAASLPTRRKVNSLIREASLRAGLHADVKVSSKSGRVFLASQLDVNTSQEWAPRSTVPPRFYTRKTTIGGAGQSRAETERIEGDTRVISRNVGAAREKRMRSEK